MRRAPLESSLLAAAAYDSERRLLEVEFHTGELYRYFNLPPHCYQELLQAHSKGRYFNANIRNQFPYQRLSHPSSPVVLAATKTK
jgi:hypothetical protein